MSEDKKPEWVDLDNPEGFASSIKKGVELAADHNQASNNRFVKKKGQEVSLADLKCGHS